MEVLLIAKDKHLHQEIIIEINRDRLLFYTKYVAAKARLAAKTK